MKKPKIPQKPKVETPIIATYWVSLKLPVTIKEHRKKINTLAEENNALAEAILAFSKKKIIRGIKDVLLKEKWI